MKRIKIITLFMIFVLIAWLAAFLAYRNSFVEELPNALEESDFDVAIEPQDRVFEITNNIINNGNRAYSEAYIVRGKSFWEMGERELALAEFEKALHYNENSKYVIERVEMYNSL